VEFIDPDTPADQEEPKKITFKRVILNRCQVGSDDCARHVKS
jgi:hypothetical protein